MVVALAPASQSMTSTLSGIGGGGERRGGRGSGREGGARGSTVVAVWMLARDRAPGHTERGKK